VAFDCTTEKAAHGHVVYVVQEVPFWAPFDAVFDTSCPGNERCAVDFSPEITYPLLVCASFISRRSRDKGVTGAIEVRVEWEQWLWE